MGKRGPKPTPTAVRKARGTDRPDERATHEPTPRAGLPSCPDGLDRRGQAVWDWLIPELESMGILAGCDRNMLERYCEMMSQWHECIAVVRERGSCYEVLKGDGSVQYASARPEASQALKLDTALQRIEAQFGLSPSARTRIEVPQDKDTVGDGKAKFFKVVS